MVDDIVDEIRQPDPMTRLGEVALQAGDGRFGGQGMRPGEVPKGLDVLLDGVEELVGVGDRNQLGRACIGRVNASTLR